MVNGYEEWVIAETIKEYLREKDIQTVLRLARQGRIPGVKIAGQWKFKLSLVDKALTNLAKSNR
ncbi:MAG: hypothetical protein HQ547_01120 [Candidatus Omnitrophica bacterium]|nr:hypothetical protein [Candidatus Omnitrophota bacterium]